jgi:hypothetical protein
MRSKGFDFAGPEQSLLRFLAISVLLLASSHVLAEENLNGTFHGVPASAFAKPPGTPPEEYLWGDGSGESRDPNDSRLYHRRGVQKKARAALPTEPDWKIDADTLAYLRDLDPESRLKVIEELPPKDRPRVEHALRKIGVHPLREALRQRLARANEAPAPIAAPSEQATDEAVGSGIDVDQAIDLLSGASSVLSAFAGTGNLPSRVSSTSTNLARQAPAASYQPTPRKRGSDITGLGSH